MKEVKISKDKVKDFLAERLTFNVLQESEDNLFLIIRNEGLGGFDKMSDEALFADLIMVIPEFQLLQLAGGDNENLIVTVKPDLEKTEDDILVDITRIIQMKL